MRRALAVACLAGGLLCPAVTVSSATPLQIAEQANLTTTSEWSLVADGLHDAFDGAFYILDQGPASVSRRIDTLNSIQTYRVLDIYTNNTSAPIAISPRSYTNLGSDGAEKVLSQTAFRSITEDLSGSDPVLAFTYGNNAFASSKLAGTVGSGDWTLLLNATNLDPGQRIGILYFATLIKDDTDRSGDGALATARSNALTGSPDLSGLSAAEIATIANFAVAAVPVPAALPLFATGLGIIGLLNWRRRKQARA